MVTDTDEETWSWVARDILLDTWTSLLAVWNCIFIYDPIPPQPSQSGEKTRLDYSELDNLTDLLNRSKIRTTNAVKNLLLGV